MVARDVAEAQRGVPDSDGFVVSEARPSLDEPSSLLPPLQGRVPALPVATAGGSGADGRPQGASRPGTPLSSDSELSLSEGVPSRRGHRGPGSPGAGAGGRRGVGEGKEERKKEDKGNDEGAEKEDEEEDEEEEDGEEEEVLVLSPRERARRERRRQRRRARRERRARQREEDAAWTRVWDTRTQSSFYFNRLTRTTRRQPPPRTVFAEQEEKRRRREEEGRRAAEEKKRKEEEERRAACRREQEAEEGRMDALTRLSTASALPEGWEHAFDEGSGMPYFVHTRTGAASWEATPIALRRALDEAERPHRSASREDSRHWAAAGDEGGEEEEDAHPLEALLSEDSDGDGDSGERRAPESPPRTEGGASPASAGGRSRGARTPLSKATPGREAPTIAEAAAAAGDGEEEAEEEEEEEENAGPLERLHRSVRAAVLRDVADRGRRELEEARRVPALSRAASVQSLSRVTEGGGSRRPWEGRDSALLPARRVATWEPAPLEQLIPAHLRRASAGGGPHSPASPAPAEGSSHRASIRRRHSRLLRTASALQRAASNAPAQEAGEGPLDRAQNAKRTWNVYTVPARDLRQRLLPAAAAPAPPQAGDASPDEAAAGEGPGGGISAAGLGGEGGGEEWDAAGWQWWGEVAQQAYGGAVESAWGQYYAETQEAREGDPASWWAALFPSPAGEGGCWDAEGGCWDEHGGYWDAFGGYYHAEGGYTATDGAFYPDTGRFYDAYGQYRDLDHTGEGEGTGATEEQEQEQEEEEQEEGPRRVATAKSVTFAGSASGAEGGDESGALPPELAWLEEADVGGARKQGEGPGVAAQDCVVVFAHDGSGEVQFATPPALDRWGERFVALRYLQLRACALRALPDSLGEKASQLEWVDLADNRLAALPELAGLTRLQWLDLSRNRLTRLPASIGQCSALEELRAPSNALHALPDSLGGLSRLRVLLLESNALETVPLSLGSCATLQTLQLAGNRGLRVPPLRLTLLGTRHTKWWLREHDQRHRWGKPPEAAGRRVGVGGEVETNAVEVVSRVESAVAASDDVVTIAWQGLTALPPTLGASAPTLRRLSLAGNEITELPRWFNGFKALQSLVLAQNCIARIDDRAFAPQVPLREVDLSANALRRLPVSLCHLKRLHTLRLSHNRLAQLPPSIHYLNGPLKHLDLDGNALKELPEAICRVTSLASLHVSNNRLTRLPDAIGDLTELRVLRASRNRLTWLPVSMRDMLVLEELHLAANLFAGIPMSLARMSAPLKSLWLQGNRIVEIESAFMHLTQLTDLRLDGNPLRSPPLALAARGREAIARYSQERDKRLKRLGDVLCEKGILFRWENLRPVARGVYAGDRGRLSDEDLSKFDRAVDRYINFDYYHYDTPIEKVADQFLELRRRRSVEERAAVLRQLINALELAETYEWVDTDRMRGDYEAPLGRDGSLVNCFAVVPSAVLTTIRLRMQQRRVRGFHDAEFDLTERAVTDALRKYRGPFGRVGRVGERVLFDVESEGATRAVEKRVWVVSRVLVTEEEAAREHSERRLLLALTKDMKAGMEAWLDSPEGALTLELAAKSQRRQLAERRRKLARVMGQARRRYFALRREHKVAELRRNRFEAGGAFESHRLVTERQARRLVRRAERRRLKARKQLLRLRSVEEELVRAEGKELTVLMQEIRTGMIAEKVREEIGETMDRLRREAVEAGLRRPWDGADGMAFKAWVQRHFANQLQTRDLARLQQLAHRGEAPDPGQPVVQAMAIAMGGDAEYAHTLQALINVHGETGDGELGELEAKVGTVETVRSDPSSASSGEEGLTTGRSAEGTERSNEHGSTARSDGSGGAKGEEEEEEEEEGEEDSSGSSEGSLHSEDLGVPDDDSALEYGGVVDDQGAQEGREKSLRQRRLAALSKTIRKARRAWRRRQRQKRKAKERNEQLEMLRAGISSSR